MNIEKYRYMIITAQQSVPGSFTLFILDNVRDASFSGFLVGDKILLDVLVFVRRDEVVSIN